MATQTNILSTSSAATVTTNPNNPPALIRAALGLGLSSAGSIKSREPKTNLPPKATISLNQLSDSVIICAILKCKC